jgi:hypothetical protein
MTGIDVTQPVSIEALPEGQQVIQYVRDGRPGSYFGLPGATPGELGISGKDRVLIDFVTTGTGQALKGTARRYSGTFGGKVPYFKAPGGGTQIMVKPKSVSIRGK